MILRVTQEGYLYLMSLGSAIYIDDPVTCPG